MACQAIHSRPRDYILFCFVVGKSLLPILSTPFLFLPVVAISGVVAPPNDPNCVRNRTVLTRNQIGSARMAIAIAAVPAPPAPLPPPVEGANRGGENKVAIHRTVLCYLGLNPVHSRDISALRNPPHIRVDYSRLDRDLGEFRGNKCASKVCFSPGIAHESGSPIFVWYSIAAELVIQSLESSPPPQFMRACAFCCKNAPRHSPCSLS